MMFWENLIDTVLNVAVFAFIGALLWLYLKAEPQGDRSHGDPPKSGPTNKGGHL